MAPPSSSKLFSLRRLLVELKSSNSSCSYPCRVYRNYSPIALLSSSPLLQQSSRAPEFSENAFASPAPSFYRGFCSQPLNLDNGAQGPAAIDYSSLLPEEEFHSLADATINDLQEKFESGRREEILERGKGSNDFERIEGGVEYGDFIEMDGFDIDYGNQVLTLKLGNLGTYVLNKQTPNRQIWLSSPVSGPSRFDWDISSQTWVYRRTKANLLQLFERELEQLCGKPISLS
ncbi:hypothetical protein HHK36_002021 [Tetracentron sinense]|uniref:ferroxidase n=1 Tax=Tetracentron sinense TaxID=13715 RepID=A0A835A4S3_TETSI|nr:hypothetical protein HHK36_002021 [Tetracentron sinense]